METKWSLGVLLGLPVAAVITLVAVGLLVFGIFIRQGESEYSHENSNIAIAVGMVMILITIPLTAALMYPFSATYHQWRQYGGTVESVSSRLLGDGQSINQRFVIQLKGQSGQVGCDDTRCSLVKPGDYLDLSCKKEWQYAGEDGLACNFVKNTKHN